MLRAIERGQAQLCILADDCNQPDYKKLIEALCAEQSVNLIAVPDPKQLGQWAGEQPVGTLPPTTPAICSRTPCRCALCRLEPG